MKNENQLWLQSLSTADVGLSDLGMKVPAGKTVDVFKVNPYLTVAQVEKSLESGALSKRLGAGILRVVEKQVIDVPKTLNHLKESDKTVTAKKTKTSVIIESKMDEAEEDGSFEFADYGVQDLGPVSQDRQDDSVMVNTKQDEHKVLDPAELLLEPEVETGVSKQSQVVMRQTQEVLTDPMGPIADASKPSPSQPFTVVKPPKDVKEEEAVSPTGNPVTKDETGAVVVGKDEDKPRSLRTVAQAQEEGDDYSLPGDDEVGADEIVDFEETEFDSKVATKTEDGSVIMKIMESKD